MKLENMCTSLSLSKKLFEIGINQDSFFFWYTPVLAPSWHLSVAPGEREICKCSKAYSAFTTDELIELLPEEISIDSFYQHMKLTIQKQHKESRVYYEANYFTYLDQEFEGVKLVDCLAQMLIYIKELKLEAES